VGCPKGKQAGSATVNAAVSEQVKLSYSIFFPASQLQAQTAEAWAREVERRNAGGHEDSRNGIIRQDRFQPRRGADRGEHILIYFSIRKRLNEVIHRQGA